MLKRAKLKYGVCRKETSICPAQAAHPGLLGQPSTLRTMGLGQTGAEQGRGMNEGGRGRLATGAAWPSYPLAPALFYPSTQIRPAGPSLVAVLGMI